MSPPRMAVAGAALLCALGLVGCRRDKALHRVEERMAAAGLAVAPFHKVKPERISAAACRLGRVEGLHVLLCAFDESRGTARTANLGDLFAEGAVTGVWAERRDDDDDRWVVLLVADRDKVDLDGQKAARVVAAFAP